MTPSYIVVPPATSKLPILTLIFKTIVIMADFNPFQAFQPLRKAKNIVTRFSFQTTYGLIVTASECGLIDVQLAACLLETAGTQPLARECDKMESKSIPIDSKCDLQSPTSDSLIPDRTSGKLGYRYYIWPDYQTSFVWYEPNWAGNPPGEDNVEQGLLEERYSPTWCSALEQWVKRYTIAFESQNCHIGSGEDPFPNLEDRNAWVLEGILLACWLALQEGVTAVEFEAESEKYLLEKGGAGVAEALGKLLQDIKSE